MKITLNLFGTMLLIVAALSLPSCNNASETTETTETVEAAPNKNDLAVMAYYTGNPKTIDQESASQLTHIIYSFFHLDGNKLRKATPEDSIALTHLASLKEANPNLKIMFSLGGWGGCEFCSQVFATEQGREEFAESVKELSDKYNLEGLDLDWEYPVVEGFPGHRFAPEDKQNFTLLVKELRETLGEDYILSFAAGGFNDFLERAIDWQEVMPMLDYVNLMTYDLVNGNSTVTGHHTPLYANTEQVESVDNAVQYLDSIGVPSEKVVIGSAFYARVWENVQDQQNGLYQTGKFKEAVNYNELEQYYKDNAGFTTYWDSTAQAPYSYNPAKQLFATYDDSLSIAKKTAYALEHDLGGIMFWQFSGDNTDEGLLDVINRVKEAKTSAQVSE